MNYKNATSHKLQKWSFHQNQMPPICFLTFPSLDRVFYFTAYSATDAEESSGDGVGDLIHKMFKLAFI